jgi:hypothetical protein
MKKLQTIIAGIIGTLISFYIADKFLNIPFDIKSSYFAIGGIISGILIYNDKK